MISDLVDLGVPAPETVVRSMLVFFFLVFALRVAGKRELAQLNVMDLAVLLLVSNSLQNAMILEGTPRTLLENGVPDQQALRKEAISVTDLSSIAHERGFRRLEDVASIVLETDGHLTVTGRESAGAEARPPIDDG